MGKGQGKEKKKKQKQQKKKKTKPIFQPSDFQGIKNKRPGYPAKKNASAKNKNLAKHCQQKSSGLGACKTNLTRPPSATKQITLYSLIIIVPKSCKPCRIFYRIVIPQFYH